jgi:hypothetical protein
MASVRSHWNVKHRADQGCFTGADHPVPETSAASEPRSVYKLKRCLVEQDKQRTNNRKAQRVSCTHCEGTFLHERSHRTHWNKIHKSEHGTYVGHGEMVAEVDCTVLTPGSLDIMNLATDHFRGCRITNDGRISVIDAIALFDGCSANTAWHKYDALISKPGLEELGLLGSHKFPGAGQRATPVAMFFQLLELLPQLPGANARILCRKNAHLCARACAGDLTLAAEIQTRYGTLNPAFRTLLLTGLERIGADLGAAEKKALVAQEEALSSKKKALVAHEEALVSTNTTWMAEQNMFTVKLKVAVADMSAIRSKGRATRVIPDDDDDDDDDGDGDDDDFSLSDRWL